MQSLQAVIDWDDDTLSLKASQTTMPDQDDRRHQASYRESHSSVVSQMQEAQPLAVRVTAKLCASSVPALCQRDLRPSPYYVGHVQPARTTPTRAYLSHKRPRLTYSPLANMPSSRGHYALGLRHDSSATVQVANTADNDIDLLRGTTVGHIIPAVPNDATRLSRGWQTRILRDTQRSNFNEHSRTLSVSRPSLKYQQQ